jgi:hypothetical protein
MPFKLKYIALALLLRMAVLQAQPEVEAPLQQQNVDTEEKTKTKIGVKFTMGAHTFIGNAFDNEKLKYGFGAGIYNIVHLNKERTFNIQWELDFTFKGSKFGKLNDTSYSKISLSYMELPAYFSVEIANTPKKQPLHLLFGAQFSYLFRSSLNKAYGKFGEVKVDLPFNRMDFAPAIGLRKEIGSGMSLQLCVKAGQINIYTNTFYERTINPDLNNKNYDYRDITPRFKDGTHKARNVGIEFSLLF